MLELDAELPVGLFDAATVFWLAEVFPAVVGAFPAVVGAFPAVVEAFPAVVCFEGPICWVCEAGTG
jgi:hypothetical protein